ncbi:MAG: beta galactosidase jelly roll domain-containing protein [Clostridiales bacterium]|nr:beta galactosidase jelly roll domain-containing protein [Clostridiales bacterium]
MSRNIMQLTSWKFHLGDVSDGWYRGGNEGGWENVTVPHDWAIRRGFSRDNSSGTGYVCGGIGWYRTRFCLHPKAGQHVRITFLGVYNNSKVWCNSNYLGKRPYGYSTFTYDITDFISPDGDNEISVMVNHTETVDSRWYTGSGITRPVYVTVTGEPYIDDFGVFVTTPSVSKDSAVVSVSASLSGCNAEVSHKIISPDGEEVLSLVGAAAEGTIENPKLWSADEPALYRLKTTVSSDGEVTDECETRFGIRKVEFDPDRGFFCNGKSEKLRGVCLHHDAGALGAAVPPEVWRRRLLNLKACGCNAVRTSHNPPDPALLDLCDEMGFYVMDEAFDEWEAPKNKWWHGHNVPAPKLNGYYEDFVEWGEKDVKTMVMRDRNHPSIIIWSVGNEVDYPNDPYVHPDFAAMTGNNDAGKTEDERRYDKNRPDASRLTTIARRLVRWVKECDTTRPVTAALAFPEMSVKTGYMQSLDIAGYNYKEKFYDEHHRTYPNAVIYGSENGHGIREWEYVKDNDYICGQFLWTGVDYLGEAQGWPIRAFGAGLLDLAGFESPRGKLRRVLWCDENVSTFAVMKPRPPHHGHRDEQNKRPPEAFVVSNGVSAELFCGSRSLGELKIEHYTARWELAEEVDEGMLSAKVTYADGTAETLTAEHPKECARISVTPWECEKSSDGAYTVTDSVCQLELCALDENGGIIGGRTLNRPVITILTDGCELLGIENGDIADLTSYGENYRAMSDGHMTVYVRGAHGASAAVKIKSELGDETLTLNFV